MLRKIAAHQKKVALAVRVLQTTTGVNVPMVMILAGFSKSDIADKIVRQQVRRRLAHQREVICVDVDNAPSLSNFTSDNDASLPTTSASLSSAPTNPKPKRKQIRPTASAVQQRRVGDLAAKKTSLTCIMQPSAYLTPIRRSQMACPSGRFTMSSHRSMIPAPVLRQSAATLPMGL